MALVLTDQTGNGYNLTATGTPGEYTSTHPFTGSNEAATYVKATPSYHQVATYNTALAPSAITLMVWCRAQVINGDYIASFQQTGGGHAAWFLVRRGTGALQFGYSSGNGGTFHDWISTNTQSTTNQWTHFGFSCDYAGNVIAMIDGVSTGGAWDAGTGNAAPDNDSTMRLNLSGNANGGAYIDANITEFRLYNTAMTLAAMQATYNVQLTTPTPSNLVAYYPFETILSGISAGNWHPQIEQPYPNAWGVVNY